MVERFVRIEEVRGSNPLSSTVTPRSSDRGVFASWLATQRRADSPACGAGWWKGAGFGYRLLGCEPAFQEKLYLAGGDEYLRE